LNATLIPDILRVFGSLDDDYETDLVSVFDCEKPPDPEAEIAPFNAKFYAINL
jgi:hypothetical protein